MSVDRRSLALLSLGGLSLFAGLTGALVLLGIGMPSATARLAAAHGLLMALGFLGTMIALERAVALRRRWAFLAPLGAGLGAVALLLGLPPIIAGGLLLGGGVVFAAMYVAFDRIEVALHIRTQAAAAVAWPVAALLWLTGRPVSGIVPWLAAFLVLIIAGERLELSRLGQLPPRARLSFIAAGAIFYAGVALSLLLPDVGARLAGGGLVALAVWLAGHDLARRTVRMAGVTRFIALCLLIGYGWLAVGGLLWIGFGAMSGAAYDAMLHTVFLGFVMSMVFGHAPVIIPAVLRVPLPYHRRFYLHLGLLHAGLLLRVVGGDLLGLQPLWQIGGVLNVIALLLFVASSATAVLQEFSARRGSPSPRLRDRAGTLVREAVRID
ncbi:MAG TPA: hypothetical protein VFM74_07180 [Candidatus Limnocylindria bacterium]|nr:hypothetical protein [Candidatus Limnocylindria bacterium]